LRLIKAARPAIGHHRQMRHARSAAIALTVLLASGQAFAQSRADQGRRIAQTYCGQCHALGAGPSPLADAPPFATLHRRYPEGGGLSDLLGEGMISPATPPEEGQPRMHPCMPQAKLDEDQIGALVAYLRAVQAVDRNHP